MSGVVLAFFAFTAMFLAHLFFSHLVRPQRKEPVLVGFMVAAVTLYVLVYLLLTTERFGSSPVLPAFVDMLTGFAAVGFLVLGYVEFWSLVERGFSLRVLVDTAASEGGLTPKEIAKAYSAGRGLEWMMEKRLEDLIGSRMLISEGGRYRLTTRGRTIARFFSAIGRLFGIE